MTSTELTVDHFKIIDKLNRDLLPLKFGPPVTHVYNPLIYARNPYDEYYRRYGSPPREILLVGMNPGPWGMAQTGVPFGEIPAVRDWLGISGKVDQPESPHPKRPVEGFDCRRSEVSGRRVWGWAKNRFGTPEKFFSRFFIINYCPLIFMEAGGRNRPPNTLPVAERRALIEVCDRALEKMVRLMTPKYVLGIGRFTEERIRKALADHDISTGGITHPSPANPLANKGWEPLVEKEFKAMGIVL